MNHQQNDLRLEKIYPHVFRLLPISLFFLFTFLTFTLSLFWKPTNFYTAIFIPDGVNYHEWLLDTERIKKLTDLSYSNRYGMTGIKFIYYPFWKINPGFSFIPNFIMFFSSLFLIKRVFSGLPARCGYFAQAALLFNPYLFLSLNSPNKEIPLIFFLCLALIIPIKNRNFILHLMISTFVYFIRDGFGLILFLWFGANYFLKLIRKEQWKGLIILIPFFISLFYQLCVKAIPAFQRNFQMSYVVHDGGHNDIINALMDTFSFKQISHFFSRVLGNCSLELFRPSLVTELGQLSVLGFGYWIYGFLLIMGTLFSAYIVISRFFDGLNKYLKFQKSDLFPKKVYDLNLFFIFYVFGISVNLFMQPRYLLPISFIPLALLGLKNNYFIIKLILGIFVFLIAGIVMTKVTGYDFFKLSVYEYKNELILPKFIYFQ